MSIKLSDDTLAAYKNSLSTIKDFNAKDLVRRDELGAEMSFADAEDDFESAIGLFKGLLDIDITRIPPSKVMVLIRDMDNFIGCVQAIKAFSSTQGVDTRQSLINNIIDSYDGWFNDISPVIAYCIKADTDYDALKRQAQQAKDDIVAELQQAKTEREETKQQTDEIIAAVQKAAHSVGVTNHTVNFQEAADSFEKKKGYWANRILGLSIVIVLYSLASFWYCPIQLEEPYLYHFLQAALPRFTGLVVLFYGLTICSRNYRAQAHNYIINKNKQNALSTFETFVNASSSEEIRNAVLLQTTKAIFSNPQSGYLKEDGSSDDSAHIIEIIKDVSKLTNR